MSIGRSNASSNANTADTISEIEAAIARLRHCSQIDLRSGWRGIEADLPLTEALNPKGWPSWTPMPLNPKGHISWADGNQVLWLGQSIRVPETLPAAQGYRIDGLTLRLALRWWAEDARVYVDGQLSQEGDIFDCFARVLLHPSVEPGQRIHIALRLVSPGHDAGALVQSQGLFERPDASPDGCSESGPEPGFIADEMAVLLRILQHCDPDQLSALAQALRHIPWADASNRSLFDNALTQLRQTLRPLGEQVTQRHMTLLGHAHLDLAWLWPIAETWGVAERTFESVLQLQERFPELIFTHSTPALYAWIEDHCPDLFQRICHRVQSGQWEIAAGLWVEPELTYVGGESIARQVLYGQRYIQERFGQQNRIAWLPDSFGFCGQLPQVLRQGGIDYFASQKLRWNDTTRFPHDWFRWQAPDGSAVLGVNLPPIGTDIDPVQMADHLCDWETATAHQTALWLPGVGDHGGGPTADMLDQVRRWQRSPFFPQMAFGSVHEFLDQIPRDAIPTWTQDLYLEFHRGCYTTHPDQKRWNRRCERQLYQAELFAALATITTTAAYPQDELTTAWKAVLFNQFHDILPGSAIRAVYDEVDPIWRETEATATRIVGTALEAIATHIALPLPPRPNAQPWVLFNSLTWQRDELVALPLPEGDSSWQACDEAGPLLCQVDPDSNRLLVQARAVPGVGYRLMWLMPGDPTNIPTESSTAPYVLDNEYLQVTLDPDTGAIAQIFDKLANRIVLSGLGNQLQAFRDQGQYWDAWNIDPDYEQHPLPVTLRAIAWQAHGPLRQCIRVIQRIGSSDIQQDYILDIGSSQLTIHSSTHWQERHTLVKAAFPLALSADEALTETPFGITPRTTRPATPAQQAQWEVPALNWSDLSDRQQNYGVSLLSDYRHGYDFQPSCIRLTLLRGACWPDPLADAGHHTWSYSLYPHRGPWGVTTVRKGYAQHHPLLPVQPSPSASQPAALPTSAQFIHLPPNVILSAFKQTEDGDGWALRGYECLGQSTPAEPSLFGDAVAVTQAVADLLEQRQSAVIQNGDSPPASPDSWRPWEIKTILIQEA